MRVSQFAAALIVVGLVADSAGAVSHVSFHADDGVEVFADLYHAPAGEAGPLILLFHQAGSNAGEYAPIAPRLVALGYSCLAVDQRSGGRRWQRNNRTVLEMGRSADFSAAYADLEAALEWVEAQGWRGPILAWGSSYSAALVFRLAAEHPQLAILLAFSPAEYLGEGAPVRAWASRLSIPMYVTSASGAEVMAARRIVDAAPSIRKSQYVAHVGVHGSSTLREDRNPGGFEENWSALEAFLAVYAVADGLQRDGEVQDGEAEGR